MKPALLVLQDEDRRFSVKDRVRVFIAYAVLIASTTAFADSGVYKMTSK